MNWYDPGGRFEDAEDDDKLSKKLRNPWGLTLTALLKRKGKGTAAALPDSPIVPIDRKKFSDCKYLNVRHIRVFDAMKA